MDKKKLIKIFVPLFIVTAITGIWFIKNKDDHILTGSSSSLGSSVNNQDFVLGASSIDLEKLQSYKLPIIIDFGADSCIPCREMAPVLAKLNTEMQEKAIIKFVDVWKYEAAANEFPIQVIPTQIFYTPDGKPYVPSEDIAIEFILYSDKESKEHVFTAHQGGLTEDQMRDILSDMGVK